MDVVELPTNVCLEMKIKIAIKTYIFHILIHNLQIVYWFCINMAEFPVW